MKLVRAFLAATAACVVAAACGRTPFDDDASAPPGPGVASRPPSRDPGSGVPRMPDPPPPVLTAPPPATAPPPPPRLVKDASLPVEDGAPRGTDGDTGAGNDAARPRDAMPSDGSRDNAPDALVAPDCSCPPLDFFVDATMGTTPIHLAAPYVLNIYCEETAVHLAHPACGQVYRLSGCYGPSSAPPCLYMGVDLVRGFILGNFIDAQGQPWNILSGSIASDPPVGRAASGTFTATLRPRAGGDVVSMSGVFHGCMPRFPPCAS